MSSIDKYMFTQDDFSVFTIEGLENRMQAIRQQIQPKFQYLDEKFIQALEPMVHHELPIHIAQHRRRTTYAPESTWSAMGGNARGYKKYPHFQLAINDKFIAMWLSFIDNPEFEKEIAAAFLVDLDCITSLPTDFVLSPDHTVNKVYSIADTEVEKYVTRFKDVKKGELQLGRIIKKEDELLARPEAAFAFMLETYQLLVPIYQKANQVRAKVKR